MGGWVPRIQNLCYLFRIFAWSRSNLFPCTLYSIWECILCISPSSLKYNCRLGWKSPPGRGCFRIWSRELSKMEFLSLAKWTQLNKWIKLCTHTPNDQLLLQSFVIYVRTLLEMQPPTMTTTIWDSTSTEGATIQFWAIWVKGLGFRGVRCLCWCLHSILSKARNFHLLFNTKQNILFCWRIHGDQGSHR